MIALITQSALIQWIFDRRDALCDVLCHRLADLGQIGSKPVISVSASTPIIDAFAVMDRHRISAVGVLSPQGDLAATTSSTDIKRFLSRRVPISQSILSFVQSLYADSFDIRAPLICVSKSTLFDNVIGRMAQAKVHRVFVVDDTDRPVEVVSITDIVKLLVNRK
eukprot:CRZ02123.1 hypothetical protein [Spongospora subterranea]